MAGTRKLIKDFFKNQLGFSDEFIIEIDRKEIDFYVYNKDSINL